LGVAKFIPMASSTVEDYLKAILSLDEDPECSISVGAIAEALAVTPGTVSAMMRHLADDALIEYVPRRSVALSEKGRAQALQVLRRHRLVETFLVEVMHLDWADVHEEAEILEHVVSDRLLARIDEMLGHPRHDPHGDPIPDASGRMEDRTLAPLPAAEDGRYRIARVSDQDSHMLDWMQANGLTIGMEIHIARGDETAGILELYRSRGEEPVRVARASARGIYVEAL